jgi:hypothetical protein
VSKIGYGQGLQPNPAGAGESREENPVTAKEHVADASDSRDLETHAIGKHADVARMDAKGLVRREIVGHDFASQFDKRLALATEFLEEKTIAAKNSSA